MAFFDHRKLRAWRLASGLRPEEVCARAQVSYSYLRAIEDGARVNPSIAVLTRLAGVFGRRVGELFTDDEPEPAGAR
jgi:transcriptional regulator with XRE-family HTH domain